MSRWRRVAAVRSRPARWHGVEIAREAIWLVLQDGQAVQTPVQRARHVRRERNVVSPQDYEAALFMVRAYHRRGISAVAPRSAVPAVSVPRPVGAQAPRRSAEPLR